MKTAEQAKPRTETQPPQHTPGPWRYQRELHQSCNDEMKIEFQVYSNSGTFANPATCNNEANARLIAAAPELLACLVRCEYSLRAAMGSLESVANDTRNIHRIASQEASTSAANLIVHINSARALIAKATGA